jgi:hypothetical protein
VKSPAPGRKEVLTAAVIPALLAVSIVMYHYDA